MAVNIKFDVLLSSLKELQQEKNCLEQKVEKCRQKRRQSELDLERGTGKYLHVKDTRNKMTETLKVALMKMEQMQQSNTHQEDANRVKRDKISAINTAIQEEKTQQTNNRNKFEDMLSKLTMEFMEARSLYKNENLHDKVISNKDKLGELEVIVSNKTNQFNDISHTLEHLSLEAPSSPVLSDAESNSVWQMMKKEQDDTCNSIKKLQVDLQELKTTQQ